MGKSNLRNLQFIFVLGATQPQVIRDEKKFAMAL